MANEIEVKLAIRPEDAVRLQARPSLDGAASGDVARRHLVSVYFDTPDLGLRRNGVSLRVRRIDGRFVQSVKREGSSALGRFECEDEIAGARPDVACVAEADIQALFEKIGAPDSLKPLFTTDIERTTWMLDIDGTSIECALDRGHIRCGRRRLPVCEIELELKGGAATALFDAAARLHRRIAVRPEWETKGQRGYALAGHPAPAPPPWPPQLSQKMRAREALAAIIDGCIGQIAAGQTLLRYGHRTEGVHKMRIGVRRLRAALSTFRRALPGGGRLPFEKGLRWLQDALGAARDWDVFSESGLAPLAKASDGDVEIRRLAQATHLARGRAHERLRDALATRRYTTLILVTLRWRHSLVADSGTASDSALQRPILDYAPRELRRRSRKIRRLGGRLDRLRGADLHKLRIRIKKLRYAAESFSNLLPRKRTQKPLRRLNKLQDALGDLNDAHTAPRLVGGLPAGGAAGGRGVAPRAEGLVKGWMAARIVADRALIARRWEKYEKVAARLQ
jgi:inorganic triphosphatase YgiF